MSEDKQDAEGRLPSFQGPRDLKLTLPPAKVAAPRRTFTPNIPSGRNRNPKPGGGPSSGGESSSEGPKKKDNRRGGGRSSRDIKPNIRGGKRDGGHSGVIQTQGVFAEGVGTETAGGKHRTPIASGSSSGLGGGRKIMSQIKKLDVKLKSEIKQEPYTSFVSDLDQDDDPHIVPVSIPLSSYTLLPSKEGLQYSENFPKSATSFSQRVNDASDEGTLVLIQLPEHLPLLQDKEDVKEISLCDDITQLPDGLIGSTNILSTGLSELVIGDNQFSLEAGTDAPFYQELVLATDDSLISLGPVRHKYLCTADVDSFLSQN